MATSPEPRGGTVATVKAWAKRALRGLGLNVSLLRRHEKARPLFYTHDALAFGRWEIGRYTYGFPLVESWGEDAALVIGDYSSIGEHVKLIMGGNHRVDWVSTYPFPAIPEQWPEAADITGHPSTKGDIRIGNDVWLGYGSSIMSGVTIGDGAVVGAFAVVANDVPPYAIVVGNPARVVRYRFSEEEIAELLRIQWWNWPESRIREAIPLLCSGRVSELIALGRASDPVPPEN